MYKLLTCIFIFLFTFTSSVNAGYFVKSESGLGVFGHEIGHSMYGDDEVTAGYLGSRFADAYTDGLWINGEDYSLGNWNIADGNSLYVGQNGVDFAKVKNRDDCGPLCLTVFGIGAIISGIGAYKGGEAKAIVDYGYLGNNEYMRPDGSHISGEDLETNLKIYGTMDIGGGLLMGAGSLMKGSPSGKGASVVNSIKSDKVSKVTNDIKKFLGNDVKVIKNKSGDTVFMGKDGAFTKKVRFDLNNPHPHKNPHTHVEIFKDNQKFYKSGQIYLKDVSKY